MARLTTKDRYDQYLKGLEFDDRRGSLTPLYQADNFNPIYNLYADVNGGNTIKQDALGDDSKSDKDRKLYSLLNNATNEDGSEKNNFRGKYDFRYGLEVLNPGHEDPTILGFDVILNTTDSPLFTEMSDFLFQFFDQIPEIGIRQDVYKEFLMNLGKFFNKSGQIDDVSDANIKSIKSHYIKSISGLENLVENVNNFTENKKQFVDWGNDKITLTLYEDVELNIGYLAMLYKTLTWSKINGKQLIPDNLLRFDMDIVISEIRNFNTVKTSLQTEGGDISSLTDIRDNVSRYIYRLYDCQFIFKGPSHKNDVNNWTEEYTDDYEIDIIYKFSTMDMEKIDHFISDRDSGYKTFIKSITNRNTKYENNDDNRPVDKVIVDGDIKTLRQSSIILPGDGVMGRVIMGEYKNINTDDEITIADPKDTNAFNVLKENAKSALQNLKDDAKDLAKQKINNVVNGLINDTIGKVRETVGLRAGISAPQNVYDEDIRTFKGVVKNTFQDFTNQSVNDLLGGLS